MAGFLSVLTPEVSKVQIDQRIIWKILGGILALAILYWFFGTKLQELLKWRVRVADVPYNIQGDGTVDTKLNIGKYQGFVQQLNATLTASYSVGWGASERCKAFERWVRDLNPNEFRYCANVYKNTYRKSIRQAVEETSFTGCWGTDYAEKFKQKLNALAIP